ncbi:MAG: DUF559 domain-containing protein [Deltaproteobacteria bacterium]
MVGIQQRASRETLWVTADHHILCQKRTRSYGAERSWRHVPQEHFQRARELRKETTPAERQLWHALRGEQLGVKFRRQHPIGPYIADFYSWEAGLVVEVDGDSHFTPESQAYDRDRDAYLNSLGLTVLRFSNQEISDQMEGVVGKIADILQRAQPSDDHDRQWRRADSLQVGDVVYFGAEQCPVEITNLLCQESEEEVYDLEVEGVHSFLTEVCAVHNCGSGTTAYVAEQWGRRWITCDTSRVAITLARQRLMTAVFDYYELAHPEEGVGSGFKYKTVPHVTLKSIANNPEIDGIYARKHPAIEQALAELNAVLKTLTPGPSPKGTGEFPRFRVTQGGRAGHVVDFSAPDTKTFTMPSGQVVKANELVEWEVPFEFPTDWPKEARHPFDRFHAARRDMQKAMDAAIARHAPQETLYDQPFVDRKKVRVTGRSRWRRCPPRRSSRWTIFWSKSLNRPTAPSPAPARRCAKPNGAMNSCAPASAARPGSTSGSRGWSRSPAAVGCMRMGRPGPATKEPIPSARRPRHTVRCAWSFPSARSTGRWSSARWPRPSKRHRRWCPNPSSSSSPPFSSTRRRPRTSTRPTGRG